MKRNLALRSARRAGPNFPPISEEMERWSALLISEVNSWPDIATKPMFGFLSALHNLRCPATITRL